MSRIDEALKRASQSTLAGRMPARVADAPLRLADELTIEQYPAEARGAFERSDLSLNRVEEPVRVIRSESRPVVKPFAPGPDSRLIVSTDRSPVSLEQYRRLAATLHEAQVARGLKTVVVTSAIPREGKTLTVTNLALTLSESYGRRVLLIDGDLRRPSVHCVLGLRNDSGLTEVMGGAPLERSVVPVSSHLSVLTSGNLKANPQAGLSSDRMRLILENAASEYEWVLLDTPPVALLSDAQILAGLAQGVVFVIRAGVTPFQLVDKAVSELGKDCIIGTVLNGVESQTILATGYYGQYEHQDR